MEKQRKKKLIIIALSLVLVLGITAVALYFLLGGDDEKEIPPHTHEYSTEYSFDDSDHWYECECGEKKDKTAHILNNGVCVCGYDLSGGNNGGNNDSTSHTHNYKTLKHDNEKHWYECECGEKSGLETHKCDTAACMQKAECTVCGKEYFKEHDLYDEVFILSGCNYEVIYSAKICKNCLESYYVESGEAVVHPHKWKLAESIEPTCTKIGYYAHFICELCGEEILGQEIEALGHVLSEPYYDNGNNHYSYCIRRDCGQKVYERHRYDWSVIEYSTCTTEGLKEGTCSLCGHQEEEIIEAEHCWDDGKETPAKCTEKGEIIYTCLVCGETETKQLDELGHDWDFVRIIKQATCTEAGIKLYKCSRCGEEKEEYYGPEHDFDVFDPENPSIFIEILKEPTCTQEGLALYTCKGCGKQEQRAIPALGHDWNDGIILKKPTCYEDGEKLFKCRRCGEQKTQTLDAGHKSTIKRKDPTCLDWGYYIRACSVCGEILNEGYLKPLGHNLVVGFNEENHWGKCSRCNYEEGKQHHELKTTALIETIDDGTQIVYKHGLFDVCTYNGCEYKKQYGEWKISIHYAVEIIPGKPATCTEDGLTPGLKCGVMGCDEVFVEQEEIIASGSHLWEEGFCLRCGETDPTYMTEGLVFALINNDTEYEVSGYHGTSTEVIIPSTYKSKPVTRIGDYAFSFCTSLQSIEMPNSVTRIGDYAFSGCASLQAIEIPDGVIFIGSGAFPNSISLTYNIKDGLKYLGNSNNPYLYLVETLDKNIISATIDNNCKFVGDFAFSDCILLTSLVMSNRIIIIDEYAFNDCTSLTSIEIPDSVTSIGRYAFSSCNSLQSIVIGKNSQLTNIGNSAFWACDSLQSVVIPGSVTNIGDEAFSFCTSLQSIIVESNNSNYKSIDGNLYSKDGSTLMQYAVKKTATSFIIPDVVTTICDGSFACCESLKSITIPDIVTEIGDSAFYGCTLLESIRIPNGVKRIGSCTFYNCSSLKSIEIPSGVTEIYNHAFYGCSALTSIEISYAVKHIGQEAFHSCSSLTEIIIPESVKYLQDYAFIYCDSLETIYFEAKKGGIGWGDYWNYGCNAEVVWGYVDTVEEEGVKYILLKDGTVRLGKQSSEITAATIKSKIIYSGTIYLVRDFVANAFAGCPLLTTVTFEENKLLWRIDNRVFSDCTSLTNILIPDSITVMGSDVFANCTLLTTIYCEAESQPSGWDSNWKGNCSAQVIWGYKG